MPTERIEQEPDRGIVIVGGGLAAVRTAQALRAAKHEGPITVLSDEDVPPYDRPPLSKKYLLGEVGDEDLALMAEEKLSELDVTVRLGARAVGVDRDARVVSLDDGDEIAYTALVAATGAGAVLLPALDGFDNVHVLRSATDARGLRAELGDGVRLGIVGGGFIGLEIASAALALGCEVTVLEGAPAPLAPVVGNELGTRVQRWHESKGVAFQCGSFLKAAHGAAGRIDELELENGTRVPVDVVVAGVGAKRNTGWIEDCGLELDDGLVVDDFGRTADPHVFGVGDVTCIRSAGGDLHPTGHWTATTEQARRVATSILEPETEQPPVVHDFYFWSDQHDLRLQFLGTIPDDPQIVYTMDEPDTGKWVAVIGDEHMTAVFGVGSPRDFIKTSMPLRKGETIALAQIEPAS